MKNLSRGAWLAIAAVAAIPTTIAIAKTADHGGWRMSPETRSRLDDGRLAMAKAALRLTPDQEKLWEPVEAQVRDAFKARETRRADWAKKREERRAERGDKHKRGDLAARFEKMSQRLAQRSERMKAFSSAFSPFYASLTDEQKDVLRPLMRDLSPRFAGHGRHHGPRWTSGGWGPDGGPRHRGHHRWHGGDRGGPDSQGGPSLQDNGPDNDGGPAQTEPDSKG
jgi:hypothetical protein